jgi:predicted nucleotidyltransferase component of viral defense system
MFIVKMTLPLAVRLKRESHRKIASAQDIIVQELYSVFNNAVIHGGTAIWRCYKGNRFSEDIDVYIRRDIAEIGLLFSNLEKKGFGIEKKKIGENSIYSTLVMDRTPVRFEAVFKRKTGHLREYETVDGNLIAVYTLTPEEFLEEKVSAYLNRLKVRDLYDIFFMLRHAKPDGKVKDCLKRLVKGFKPPVDVKDLKVLILDGLVPDVAKMVEYINNRI